MDDPDRKHQSNPSYLCRIGNLWKSNNGGGTGTPLLVRNDPPGYPTPHRQCRLASIGDELSRQECLHQFDGRQISGAPPTRASWQNITAGNSDSLY